MNRLRQDGTVDLVSASDEVIQVAYPDHPVSIAKGMIPSLVNIVRWANPVKPSDFKTALEQTYDWAEAEETMSRCRHKVRVADLTGAGLPYQERYELIAAVLRAVVEVSRPRAIHWEPADCIVAPESLARRLSWSSLGGRCHTATPMANGGNWRYSAALSEFESVFLNGPQRSVNRKVQGSNPWSGANLMSHDIVESVSGRDSVRIPDHLASIADREFQAW